MTRKLFSADPARIGRFDGPPTSDAVPASLVEGTPGDLKADLIALLGKENVLHRAIDLVRYASGASPYRLVPQVVVLPRTTDDIVKLFRYCRETGRHATFRAAGTSLNGQSQSDDILIDARRHWYGGKVEDDGRRVRARPGMILGHINSLLQRHGRRLGPDPASSHACTIGGVIANNAGGMRCTVQKDAYHTVSALTFVTPSGAVIDTSRPDAEKEFAQAEPQLAEGLLELRKELLADPVLADRTRRKYSIRNTHGLRLCALLDGETPLEIFRRLLVGSEGTLGFIAEAVLQTVPAPRVTRVAWIPVPTIDEAIALVPGLVALGASAVELMIAPALTAAGRAFAATPCYWRTLDPKAAALLVEIGAADSDSLEATQHQVLELVSAAAVYFCACINRMFGRDPARPASPSLAETFVSLSRRAGKPLWIPPDVAGLCCSTPWKSKAYVQGHKYMAQAVADALWRWSDGGALPIVVDAASCSLGLREDIATQLEGERKKQYESLEIIDSIAWCRDLLPNLTITRTLRRVAVHPTCSTTHLGLAGVLKQIAGRLADEVEVPVGTTCCGTAGDRGLLHPELVVSATREVRSVLDARPADAYLSANRTCEMGLRHATGRPYESFIFLLEELSRPEAG